MKQQDYINSLVKYVENDSEYKARNDRIASVEQRRFMQRKPLMPTEYEKKVTEFRSSFIFDILRRAPGLTSVQFPEPKVTPLKSGPEAQINTSLREQWLKAAYVRMDRDSNIYHKLMDAFFAKGAAVWKVIVDKHRFANPEKDTDEKDADYLDRSEEHRRKNFPFYWEPINYECYYGFNDDDGLCEALIITKQSKMRLAKKYNIHPDAEGHWSRGAPDDTLTGDAKFVEYWSRTKYAYLVEDIIVGKGEHDYDRVPIFVAPMTMTSSTDKANECFGLADPLVPMQDAFDDLVTGKEYWGSLNNFPYAGLRPTSENVLPIDPKNAKVELKYGQVYIPPPGWELTWIVPPGTSRDSNEMVSLIKQMIDQTGLAPILFGTFPNDTSSSAMNTMIAVSKSIFGPGLDNMARAFDDMAEFLQQQVEHLGKDGVPVWVEPPDQETAGKYEALKPSDIKGYYRVRHNLSPVLPAEQQAKYMYLADAFARGLVTADYVREEGMAIGSPEDMGDSVWLEKAAQDPRVNNVIMGESLRPYAKQEAAAAMMPGSDAMQAMTANQPISPGGPGAMGAQGINQGMAPGQRVMTRQPGMGANNG